MTIANGVAPRSTGSESSNLGLVTKILYGVGEASTSIRTVMFGLFVLFFYSSVMGLSGTLVGVASAIGLIWNAVLDPTVGFISDRHAGALGRRHGLMLLGGLGVGVFGWALFRPPLGLSIPVLFAWLLVTSLLLRLASSLFGIPFLALGAELSHDYHERSTIAGIRGGFGLIGTVAAASLPFVFFFPNRLPNVDPKLNYNGYPSLGLALGVAMTVAALIATISTLPWRRVGRPIDHKRAPASSFSRGFMTALANRPFRILLFSFSLVFLGTVVNTVLSIHFLTYYVRILDSRQVSAVQGAFYGAAIVGIVVWLRLAKTVEKRNLYLWATIATAVLLVIARLLVGPGRPFGVGDVRPLLVGEGLAGLFASVFWIIPPAMVADVLDEDELTTGERREGLFYGIFSFGQQVAGGIAAVITGILIDKYAGLVPGQAIQSAQTAERIGQLDTIVPAALFVVAALLIWRYPLNQWRVATVQQELKQRGVPTVDRSLVP